MRRVPVPSLTPGAADSLKSGTRKELGSTGMPREQDSGTRGGPGPPVPLPSALQKHGTGVLEGIQDCWEVSAAAGSSEASGT